MFFDVAEDPAREVWRTRIYHEESGQEDILTGPGTAEWSGWIRARLDAGLPPTAEPAGREVHRLAVEVVGVRLISRTSDGDDVDIVHIESSLRIDGLAALAKAVGAAAVSRGIAP